MTASIDINTFCPLDTFIPTFEDGEEGALFIVNEHLLAALGLPENFDPEAFLPDKDWERRKSGYSGSADTWQLVTEAGFYKLVLEGEATSARAFQHWVFRVVLPVIAQDGVYLWQEENDYPVPELGNSDRWPKTDRCWEPLVSNLAVEVLPRIRRDQMLIALTQRLEMLASPSRGMEAQLDKLVGQKEVRRRMAQQSA